MTPAEKKQARAEFARVVGDVRRKLLSYGEDKKGFAVLTETASGYAEIRTTMVNGPRIELFAKSGNVKLNGQLQENTDAALVAAGQQIEAAKNKSAATRNNAPRP